jgi:general secretion pathway protein C
MHVGKRFFQASMILLVALAAALDARAITTLVGTRLASDAPTLAASHGAVRDTSTIAQDERSVSAEPIVRRNPFDHATPLVPPAPPPPRSPSDPAPMPACEGVRVVAIAASSEQAWSFAALALDSAPSVLRRQGDQVGVRRVAFVGREEVWLEEGTGYCRATLFAEKTPAPKPPVKATPQVGAGAVPPDIARGIKRLSASEFEIDRATFDRVLDSQLHLLMQARLAPDMIDGRVAGLRLLGVKPDSVLGLIGLVDNDRLESINGIDIGTPQQALEAYARIRTGERFSLRLSRGNRPMTLDYAVK